MMLVSGMTRPVLPSRSTGILPTGHSAKKLARDASSSRSTCFGTKGVALSYKPISTL